MNLISFDDGECLDLDTVEGAYKYVGRFLSDGGASGGVFSCLEKVYKSRNSLLELIRDEAPAQAPTKTTRTKDHVEFLIGIGKDETASIVMTTAALDVLKAGA